MLSTNPHYQLPLSASLGVPILMTSKRGRKRNDNLPPNRARDVQRAFRARRAAHLIALEQRVTELHEENARLRKMVGWPPDDRPPLGRGPTGKDKPKLIDGDGGSYAIDVFSSQGSESDSSPRAGSLSPSVIASSSRGLHVIDDSETWDNTFTMDDASDPPPESPYHQLQPTESPVSTKSIHPSYGNGLSSSLPSSSSRSPIVSSPTNAYMHSPTTYSHSTERLGVSYSSPSFVGRSTEIRVDSPREHYSYHALPYQDHDTTVHCQSPPLSSTTSHLQSHTSLHQRHMPVPGPFTHRRAFTEQCSISHSLHLPIPAQMQVHQALRPLDQHRIHDGTTEHQHSQQEPLELQENTYRIESYGPDTRMNSMP
ncbi:hypothetical protein H2248_008320 [Termitomyces sp. 'cryptogamus']|nr:hypothetical protein H2248_008320 [Termitomyces sp. 'cryptogamus']